MKNGLQKGKKLDLGTSMYKNLSSIPPPPPSPPPRALVPLRKFSRNYPQSTAGPGVEIFLPKTAVVVSLVQWGKKKFGIQRGFSPPHFVRDEAPQWRKKVSVVTTRLMTLDVLKLAKMLSV